ncbi:MAG: GrpB family protein, partial [Bacillota bacterium]
MSKSLSEMSLEELWQLFPIILKEYNPELVAKPTVDILLEISFEANIEIVESKLKKSG